MGVLRSDFPGLEEFFLPLAFLWLAEVRAVRSFVMTFLTRFMWLLMVCAVVSGNGDNVTTVLESNSVDGNGSQNGEADYVGEEAGNLTGKSPFYLSGSRVCFPPCRIIGNDRCVDDSGRFRCAQPMHDLCTVDSCLNGGACYAVGTTYRCECSPPYYGTRCELRADQCRTNPCRNSCECVPSCRHASGYFCRSTKGYIGKNCTVPPPDVQCLPNQVVVSVDDAFVKEYDMGIGNSRLLLARGADAFDPSPSCFATTKGRIHTFVISLPFSKCGTEVVTSSWNTMARGNIWLNRITRAAYDMPVPVISFQCMYRKEYAIVTSLEPAVDRPVVTREKGYIKMEGVIELCKVSACPRSCPAEFGVTKGAIYTIGEMIHLNIQPREDHQVIVALKSLHLSCDGSSTATAVVQLVQNGCSVSSTPTVIFHSGRDFSVCVSFQVLRLLRCVAFYIHAEMEICQQTGCRYGGRLCGSNFVQSRNRRSAVPLIITDIKGPIYWINGSLGIGSNVLFPNRSIVDVPFAIDDLTRSRNRDLESRTLLIVGISLVFVLVVLGIAILSSFRKSRCS